MGAKIVRKVNLKKIMGEQPVFCIICYKCKFNEICLARFQDVCHHRKLELAK